MNHYRITKYNPAYRDDSGFYTKNDWISIYDIGQTFDDGILTPQAYRCVEDAYVAAVTLILQEKAVTQMTVCGLEKNDCMEEAIHSPVEKAFHASITDGAVFCTNGVETAVRLALRELIWCRLSAPEQTVEVGFGYDYYMYVRCDEVSAEVRKKITDSGLFLEQIQENVG